MPLNYYVWVLRAPSHTVLVDTGFSAATAQRRHLTLLRDPLDALGALGLAEADVDDLIMTHLHVMQRFPAAPGGADFVVRLD